jgi:dATP pyrophosphohydrolase
MIQEDCNEDEGISMMSRCSMVIIKPDLMEMGKEIELREIFQKNNLQINFIGTIVVDLFFIKEYYQWDSIKFPNELNDYLCNKPLPVWIIKGNDAIKKTLSIKKYFRKKYSKNAMHNLMHCSDSNKDFEREYRLVLRKIKKDKMRTNNQIEVIVFKKINSNVFFLILKRNSQKGGFWQPITGGVEEGETFEEAAIREINEEIGNINNIKLIDIDYSFDFFEENTKHIEKVFGVEVSPEQVITISSEHTEFKWVDGQIAINKFLKYPGNKEGFKKLIEFLEKEVV